MIQEASENSISMVLDSLCPLLMRHGFCKTVHFVKTLMNLPGVCPLVVPVQVDGLSTRQNQIIEDLAWAVLCLSHGEATLLRQGVREKGNLVRSSLSYETVANETDKQTTIRVSSGPPDALGSQLEPFDYVDQKGVKNNAPSKKANTEAATDRRAKVRLELEKDAAPQKQNHAHSHPQSNAEATSFAPRIFLQDDDPEYDDYDDEDPDDDLEI